MQAASDWQEISNKEYISTMDILGSDFIKQEEVDLILQACDLSTWDKEYYQLEPYYQSFDHCVEERCQVIILQKRYLVTKDSKIGSLLPQDTPRADGLCPLNIFIAVRKHSDDWWTVYDECLSISHKYFRASEIEGLVDLLKTTIGHYKKIEDIK